MLGVELLSRMRSPVILIDERRRVHHANKVASHTLQETCGLTLRSGHLHCTYLGDDREFSQSLAALLEQSDDCGQRQAHQFVRIRCDSRDKYLGISMHPIQPSETLGVFGTARLAMLVLQRTGGPLELDPFIVSSTFDLTPAEARVAVAIARGVSPAEFARKHQVSVATVRTQLKTVYSKTGVSRQAELVSILASTSLGMLA